MDLTCTPTATLQVTPGTTCSSTPAGNGSFSQNVQRLGFYAQDSWRVTPRLTVNYGLRYDTTLRTLHASGQSQLQQSRAADAARSADPALPASGRAARLPAAVRAAPGNRLRAGRIQKHGAARRLRSLLQRSGAERLGDRVPGRESSRPAFALNPGDPGCLPGAANGGAGALIDPAYKTPYALHATRRHRACFQCALDG